jgi:signal recognition particle subunit SRP54
MFETLSDRLEGVVNRLRGMHKLTEENISDAAREVRLALLEADVNVAVVKELITELRKEALGVKTAPGLTPGQHLIKIVHDKLTDILGGETAGIVFAERGPTTILMTGLQGSGKTTTSAKLAKHIKKLGYQPMLVSTDVYRPAAMDQLAVLAADLQMPLYPALPTQKPVDICKAALAAMKEHKANVLIVDTAGRLHIDDDMMDELAAIKKIVTPTEILFVADAMTGQDAVTVAKVFADKIGMTGVALTKMDGDTRGGAALSIKKVTGAPVKFAGIGEKIDQFEPFHPERVASRILGMGDVMTLIEKAQENIDQKTAERQAEKMLSANFDLNDFLEQLQMIKKMGPLDQLFKMLPGMGGALKNFTPDPDELTRVEAIINSMTNKERAQPGIINTSRKRRIADGSGNEIIDVNKLLKNFQKSRKLMKSMGKMKGNKAFANPLGGLGLGS